MHIMISQIENVSSKLMLNRIFFVQNYEVTRVLSGSATVPTATATQCLNVKFSLSCPEMLSKFPSLFDHHNFTRLGTNSTGSAQFLVTKVDWLTISLSISLAAMLVTLGEGHGATGVF